MVKDSRAHFFNSLDSSFRSNPKRFWSIFKLNNKQSSIPDTMSMGTSNGSNTSHHCSASTTSTIADLFNRYFISIFSSSKIEVQSYPTRQSTLSSLSEVQLSEVEVLMMLLSLDTTTKVVAYFVTYVTTYCN